MNQIKMVEIFPSIHEQYNGFYYKIINSNFGIPGNLIYTKGSNNIPSHLLDKDPDDGIYFTDIKNIFWYLNYGPILAELIIPKDAIVKSSFDVMGPNIYVPEMRSNKIFIKNYYNITSAETIDYLIANGADISVNNYHLFKYALWRSLDIWNYLSQKYPEIIRDNADWIFT